MAFVDAKKYLVQGGGFLRYSLLQVQQSTLIEHPCDIHELFLGTR